MKTSAEDLTTSGIPPIHHVLDIFVAQVRSPPLPTYSLQRFPAIGRALLLDKFCLWMTSTPSCLRASPHRKCFADRIYPAQVWDLVPSYGSYRKTSVVALLARSILGTIKQALFHHGLRMWVANSFKLHYCVALGSCFLVCACRVLMALSGHDLHAMHLRVWCVFACIHKPSG